MEIKLVNASLSDWAANEARKKQALRSGKTELKTAIAFYLCYILTSPFPRYILYILRLITQLAEYSIDNSIE